jgi:hypothetical protein
MVSRGSYAKLVCTEFSGQDQGVLGPAKAERRRLCALTLHSIRSMYGVVIFSDGVIV